MIRRFKISTYVMPMVQNVSSTMRIVSLEPLMDDSPAKAAMLAEGGGEPHSKEAEKRV